MSRPSLTPPFARTPEPPYYAAIFSSTRAPGDNGYGQMVEHIIGCTLLGVRLLKAEHGVAA